MCACLRWLLRACRAVRPFVKRLTGLVWSIHTADSIRQAIMEGTSASIDSPLAPDHSWSTPADIMPGEQVKSLRQVCEMTRFLLGSSFKASGDSPMANGLHELITGASAAGSVYKTALQEALEAELCAADRMFLCSSGASRCSADVC